MLKRNSCVSLHDGPPKLPPLSTLSVVVDLGISNDRWLLVREVDREELFTQGSSDVLERRHIVAAILSMMSIFPLLALVLFSR